MSVAITATVRVRRAVGMSGKGLSHCPDCERVWLSQPHPYL